MTASIDTSVEAASSHRYSGADRLVGAAAAHGIELCLANPGTTEMGLVAALDRGASLRTSLVLFEGVATGAADGFARITGKPAMTVLHLGPGLAYGLPNMHNAHRARSPMLTVVGNHTTEHLPFDSPLTTDIAILAQPMSRWVDRSRSAETIDLSLATGIRAAIQDRDVATLIVPADHQTDAAEPLSAATANRYRTWQPHPRPRPANNAVDAVAARLQATDARPVFLVGGDALDLRCRTALDRLCNRTGGRAFTGTTAARLDRGGDRPEFDRLPYFPEDAVAALSGAAPLVLVGTRSPVAFFAYPEHPSDLAEGLTTLTLATEEEDSYAAITALNDALSGMPDRSPIMRRSTGGANKITDGDRLNGWSIGSVVASTMPDDAIVSIEGSTVGHSFFKASQSGPHHSVLTNTGGAIGQGLPVAFGAALAAPHRRVVAIQSDGSAQYTIQTLWSMAREGTDVTVVLVSNRRYGILDTELRRHGHSGGELARALTSLTDPCLDWCATARGYGLPSVRAHSVGELRTALRNAHAEPGPTLIEAVVA